MWTRGEKREERERERRAARGRKEEREAGDARGMWGCAEERCCLLRPPPRFFFWILLLFCIFGRCASLMGVRCYAAWNGGGLFLGVQEEASECIYCSDTGSRRVGERASACGRAESRQSGRTREERVSRHK